MSMGEAQAPLRVLVVDDDPLQLELAERILSRYACEVYTTSSPTGVSSLARDHDPDVVLVDMNLPGLTPARVVEIVRRDTSSRARVVLYSAADADELRALAAALAADGWIQKGLVWGELADRLRRICKR